MGLHFLQACSIREEQLKKDLTIKIYSEKLLKIGSQIDAEIEKTNKVLMNEIKILTENTHAHTYTHT